MAFNWSTLKSLAKKDSTIHCFKENLSKVEIFLKIESSTCSLQYLTKNKNVKARVFNWLDKIYLPNSYNFFEFCPSKNVFSGFIMARVLIIFLLSTYITILIKPLNKQGLPKLRIIKQFLKGFFNQKPIQKICTRKI